VKTSLRSARRCCYKEKKLKRTSYLRRNQSGKKGKNGLGYSTTLTEVNLPLLTQLAERREEKPDGEVTITAGEKKNGLVGKRIQGN